jgi:hypothetical protein
MAHEIIKDSSGERFLIDVAAIVAVEETAQHSEASPSGILVLYVHLSNGDMLVIDDCDRTLLDHFAKLVNSTDSNKAPFDASKLRFGTALIRNGERWRLESIKDGRLTFVLYPKVADVGAKPQQAVFSVMAVNEMYRNGDGEFYFNERRL